MNRRTKTYKDLVIWKKAFENSLLVLRLIKKLPKTSENRIITNQLTRSIMSVGANIAEGYGRYGGKEYSRFLQISLGSANESEYWLLLLQECNKKYRNEIEFIIENNCESIKIPASSIKTIINK